MFPCSPAPVSVLGRLLHPESWGGDISCFTPYSLSSSQFLLTFCVPVEGVSCPSPIGGRPILCNSSLSWTHESFLSFSQGQTFFFFFCRTRASHCCGLSRCGAQAPDAQAQRPWLTGPATLWHVGSSQTRARTCVPCIGRQTLNHCATRKAPVYIFF